MRSSTTALALTLVLLLLPGCGQTGPLYLPPEGPAEAPGPAAEEEAPEEEDEEDEEDGGTEEP